MYIVQRHYEDDNGNDTIWFFNYKDNALGFLQNRVEAYEKMSGDTPNMESYDNEIIYTFKNANGSYTKFTFAKVEMED